MFSNRSLQVQLIKKPKTPKTTTSSTPDSSTIDLQKISPIIKEHVKHTAVAIVGVYAAIVALNTASEIAVNAAPKKH